MNSNWRNSQEWQKQGFKFNTTSNEACKLYDAALSQYVSWYEIDQLQGLCGTLKSLLEADNNFVMGYVIDIGINYIGNPGLVVNYSQKLKTLNSLKNKLKDNLSKEELLHVDAVNLLAYGDLVSATECWEKILIEKPTDMLALKFAHDFYFYLGHQRQMRDSIARVLPLWNKNLPLYSYLFGMHSFGLTQTNFFNEALKTAKKGLELNQNDAWATHSICHYNEYLNDTENGIKFLLQTEADWSICKMLSCHDYWHLALYYLESGNHEAALDVYDKHVYSQAKENHAYLDIVDANSFLYRLKLDGFKLDANNERLTNLNEICVQHLHEHSLAFNDAHVFMNLSLCKDDKAKKTFMDNLSKFLASEQNEFAELPNEYKNSSVQNHLKKVYEVVGKKLLQSIELFNEEKYSDVVDLLYPIRYDIVSIGGSNAQRDLFHQILTQSALKSHLKTHKKIGVALINERNGLKPSSKLTQRLADRFLATHEIES